MFGFLKKKKKKPVFRIEVTNRQKRTNSFYSSSQSSMFLKFENATEERILLKPLTFQYFKKMDFEDEKTAQQERFHVFYVKDVKFDSENVIYVSVSPTGLPTEEYMDILFWKKDFLAVKEEFYKYSINADYEDIVIYKDEEKLMISPAIIPYKNNLKEEFRYKIFPMVVDIFMNYDEEILNAFGNGIFDILSEMKRFILEENTSDELFEQVKSYIYNVYETILSMGEYKETFPTVQQYLDIKEAERLEEIKRLKEAEDLKIKQRNKFVEELTLRQDLLKDFNRPLQLKSTE